MIIIAISLLLITLRTVHVQVYNKATDNWHFGGLPHKNAYIFILTTKNKKNVRKCRQKPLQRDRECPRDPNPCKRNG